MSTSRIVSSVANAFSGIGALMATHVLMIATTTPSIPGRSPETVIPAIDVGHALMGAPELLPETSEPDLLLGSNGGGTAAVIYLKFHVPEDDRIGPHAAAGAQLVLTRKSGDLPTYLEVAAVDPDSWQAIDGKVEDPPAHGSVLASAAPERGSDAVAFDLTDAVRHPGTYSFALSAPNPNGLTTFAGRGDDGPTLRLRPGSDADSPEMSTAAPPTPAPPTAEPPTPAPPTAEPPTPAPPTPAPPTAQPPTPAPPTAQPPTPAPPRSPGCVATAPLLVPSCGALWGVAPAAHTGLARTAALAGFEERTERRQAVFHSYHRGQSLFPTAEEISIARSGSSPRILFVNWKPRGVSWREIAAGDSGIDAFLDRLASHIREKFPYPFFFTVHHEPENDVVADPESGWTAKDYAAMFRYVVHRLRANGVSNMVTVMVHLAYPPLVAKPWFDDLFPGDDVVDWVAWDVYAYSEPGYGYGDFAELMNRGSGAGFYTWAARRHPTKPLMIAEWGVWYSEKNHLHQGKVFQTAAYQIRSFPRIKAMLYFDTPSNQQGLDSRVDRTEEGLAAYRKLGADPMFSATCSPAE